MQFRDIEHLREMIGQDLPPTDWLTITQAMVNQFAKVTQDEQWIHTDPERANSESPFGAPIAHGFLVLSLYAHFAEAALQIANTKMVVNYGADKVRFLTPVPVGSRLRMVARVLEIKPYRGGGHKIVTLGNILLEGAEKPACVVEAIALVF